jgi:UDP-N-acetylglucosamine--N-acetylmuramyl-(pentapeptide) pyrophosphoryl-undecaprenol N-acetylglucosamine transferase
MRVQFAPSGVGLGHAGRCIPIARGLQKRNINTEVFFSTYLDAVSYVRQEGFPTVEIPPMDFKVKPDGTVDFRRTAMSPGPFAASFNFLEQVGKEIEVMGTFEPDVVVSDSRASPIVAARMLGIPTICILNQFQVIIPRKTHLLRLAKFADAITLALIGKIWTTGAKVMIPDFPPPYTISTGNLRTPKAYRKKIKLIGPILPIRPDGLPTREELRKKLGLQDEKPVIFAPISGPLKERAYLISILQRIFTSFPDDYQIVMSLGYPKSQAAPVQNGNFAVFRWIANRFEYLKACDIVICRAGHGTLLQTICYGKPAILIPTPSHTEQLNNARKGVALGVALMIEQENLSRETLLSKIKEIMKDGKFAEKSVEIQKEVSLADGLETAIETTLEVVEGGKACVSA